MIRHKRVVRDSVGLLSSDWLKITHISYQKSVMVVTGSEIGEFEDDEKCCIRKRNQCVTHL